MMSIASRIRWRRRIALITPSLSWGRASTAAVPDQYYVILVWLGCVAQIGFARPKGMF